MPGRSAALRSGRASAARRSRPRSASSRPNCNIEIYAGAGDLVGTLPLAEAVRLGLFDGATVELDRLFAPPPADSGSGGLDTSLGVLLWFYGRVAECEVGRSTIAVRVKSLMNLLAVQQMPRRLYQASCGHVFGDTMCGYDRTAGENAAGTPTGVGAVTISAQSGSTQAQIVTTFSPSPATAYDQGTMTCLTGANAGASRTISSLAGGILYQLSRGCRRWRSATPSSYCRAATIRPPPATPPSRTSPASAASPTSRLPRPRHEYGCHPRKPARARLGKVDPGLRRDDIAVAERVVRPKAGSARRFTTRHG